MTWYCWKNHPERCKGPVLRLLCSISISTIIYSSEYLLHIKLIGAPSYQLCQLPPSTFYHVLRLFLFKPHLFCWLTIIRSTCCLSLTFLRDTQIGLKHWQLIFLLFSAWHIYNIKVVLFLCRNEIKLWEKSRIFETKINDRCTFQIGL